MHSTTSTTAPRLTAILAVVIDPASFRDPSGRVHHADGRIYRTVEPASVADYLFARRTEALGSLIEQGTVLEAEEVDPGVLGEAAPTGGLVLEHPRIPFWSYPYEWPFGALKAAALAHLDIQISLLGHGVALSDASAYNIQFRGPRPVFIDALSFRRYRPNEHWAGYRQFSEQFLNPLLLRAKFGVHYHDCYRGRPEGVTTEGVARLARWRHHLSLGMLMHVIAPGRLQAHIGDRVAERAAKAKARGLPLSSYRGLLAQLRNWIATLELREQGPTPWADYAENTTYDRAEAAEKRAMVERFVRATRPSLLLDLGCNTGEYAALALRSGARKVVGLESDQESLERAFARADGDGLDFLPLHQDCANPSPSQGWFQAEHKGLAERCVDVDAVFALAFVHHLAIGRNVPLADVVRWIAALAPSGLIEFVRKDDPTVSGMLSVRTDVFGNYTADEFVWALRRHARVVSRRTISATGREIVWFDRGGLA